MQICLHLSVDSYSATSCDSGGGDLFDPATISRLGGVME